MTPFVFKLNVYLFLKRCYNTIKTNLECAQISDIRIYLKKWCDLICYNCNCYTMCAKGVSKINDVLMNT